MPSMAKVSRPVSPSVGADLAGQVLQRQDPHPDQVGPMDPLVLLGDDRAHALQERPLGRPVAAAPDPYSLPASTTSGVLAGIAHGGVEDAHPLAAGQVLGDVALLVGASRLRSRMLAKVPRIITSWWPRRAPYC